MSSEHTSNASAQQESDIVQLDVQFEKELKTFSKVFKYSKKKPLGDQFNEICALFELPTDKIEHYSLQFGKAGAYYTAGMGSIPDDVLRGPVSVKHQNQQKKILTCSCFS